MDRIITIACTAVCSLCLVVFAVMSDGVSRDVYFASLLVVGSMAGMMMLMDRKK